MIHRHVLSAGHYRQDRDHRLGHGSTDRCEQRAGDAFGDLQALAQMLEGIGEDFSGDEDRDEGAEKKEPDHVSRFAVCKWRPDQDSNLGPLA